MAEVTVDHGGNRDGWIWLSVNGVGQWVKAGEPTDLDTSEQEVLDHAMLSYDVVASGNLTNIATNNAADGVYTLNGETVAITDIVDATNGETNFDPVVDLDADGIKLRDDGGGAFLTRQLAMTPALAATLLTTGFTIVAELYAGTTISFSVSAHDDAFTMDAGGTTTHSAAIPDVQSEVKYTSVTDKDFNGPTDATKFPAFSQISKFALTVAADRVSASINGSELVTQVGPGLDAAMAQVVLSLSGDGDARLRSFTFYDVVADADLPTLSALS
jgi:hypothetical protein